MRIFLAGDHRSGRGPANVTKYYIDNLPAGTLYQKRSGRAARVPELLINTIKADVIVYSGYSKQNILGMKMARLLKKPTAYIMHGCVEYENEINLEPDEEMIRVDRKTMELADLVLAVSESFCRWLKDYYPMYAGKIDSLTNGIDKDLFRNATERIEKERHMIFTIGGGMPRKKIKHICDAIQRLRNSYDSSLWLCVAGSQGADSLKIDSYDFVKDLGVVTFDECLKLFDDAALFVQNSSFETFGLAPLEALVRQCPILCSRNVGALEVLKDLRGEDVINDCDDIEEIAEKIRYNMEYSNAERLLAGIDWESYSWKARSRALIQKLSELVSKH